MTQLSLLTASLNALPDVKSAMRAAAADSHLSREQICDRMNELAEQHGFRLQGNGGLRVATLEKWLNPCEREHAPSLLGVLLFCRVLGCAQPLRSLVAPLGLHVIGEDDARLLRLAQVEDEIERLRRERRRLKESR